MTENNQTVETKEQLTKRIEKAKKQREEAMKRNDLLFKIGGTSTLIGLVVCLHNLPAFRERANEKGIQVVSLSSFWWCFAAFVFHLVLISQKKVTRKLLMPLAKDFFLSHLHPKNKYYSEEEREDKLKTLTNQTFQAFFHLALTAVAFFAFREEFWFPSVLGGCGSCETTFKNYPNWPSRNSLLMEAYYQIQIGTYVYLMVDLLILSRERLLKKNFSELFYHHIVAFILIFCSFLFHFFQIGTMVFFVHDASDSFRGFSRVIGESKLCIIYPKLGVYFNYVYFAVFVYLRLIVFPFCLIDSMYTSLPMEGHQWNISLVQQACLTILSIGIFFIQCFWSFLMKKSIQLEKAKNKFFIRQYEQQKIKKQE